MAQHECALADRLAQAISDFRRAFDASVAAVHRRPGRRGRVSPGHYQAAATEVRAVRAWDQTWRVFVWFFPRRMAVVEVDVKGKARVPIV